MSNFLKNTLMSVTLALAVTHNVYANEKVLHIYNWSDYIAEETIPNFEKETGIKVIYDVYDSNETLEAKLMTGNSGFDIVSPTAVPFLARQIQAGVYAPLDKSKLTNYGNLDPVLMKTFENSDPGNKYAIPYLGGTVGIGYNEEKVKAAFGDTPAPVNSWDLVFKPENIAKLKGCGVAFLDSPTEILPTVLHYLGKNPNSEEAKDYNEVAQAVMLSIRPSITYFHSSQFINDLANGDICVAIGWSGDILQAKDRAEEANKGVKVSYRIPDEGSLLWFDMLAIPKDAKNIDNAHLFLNYLLRPEVMASITNTVHYANANKASKPLVNKEITENPGIYPPDEVVAKFFTLKPLPQKLDRVLTRVWTTVKTGK